MDLFFILTYVIGFIISFVVLTIFLKIALGVIDKSKKTDLGEVAVTTVAILIILYLSSFLGGLIGYGLVMTIVGAVICLLVISKRHQISFLMAIVVAILAFIIFIIVTVVLVGILVVAIIALF